MLRHTLVSLAFSVVLFTVVGCGDSTNTPSDPSRFPSTTEELEKSLNVVNGFVLQKEGWFAFDREAAQKAGISTEDIQIGEEIASLASDALVGAEIGHERFQRFEPFFISVVERSHVTKGRIGSKVALHCPSISEKSVADAKSYLLALGYHPVNPPWTAVPGRDYAKFITTTHWPGSFSPFWTYRAQGVAREDNRLIFFQEPEPNPELDKYPWRIYPGTWWGPFVWWWHRYYCN